MASRAKKKIYEFPNINPQAQKKTFSMGRIEISGLADDACFDHLSREIMQSTTLKELFFNLTVVLL